MKINPSILIVIILLFSCKTHKNLVNQENISGEYISKSTNELSDGNFNIVNENVHHLILNNDNTFKYSNKIISKSDVITEDELSWGGGNWIFNNGYLVLNSREYFPNIKIDEIEKPNELNVKLIVDDFLNEIDSNDFRIYVCKDDNDCVQLKSNSPINYGEKSLFIKIIPNYDSVQQHWILNNKELKTGNINFPFSKTGLNITVNIDYKDFIFSSFKNKKVKISNEFLIFDKKKLFKISNNTKR